MGGAEKLRAKKKKKVNTGCSQMHQINRAFPWWRGEGQCGYSQPASDDTGPSSFGQTINAGMSGCVGSGCNFQARWELQFVFLDVFRAHRTRLSADLISYIGSADQI